MEVATWTVVCILLGGLALFYSLLAWLVSSVLSRILRFDISVSGIGFFSVGEITIRRGPVQLEVASVLLRRGVLLPNGSRSRLLSLQLGAVQVVITPTSATSETAQQIGKPPVKAVRSSGRGWQKSLAVRICQCIDVVLHSAIVHVAAPDSGNAAVQLKVPTGARLGLSKKKQLPHVEFSVHHAELLLLRSLQGADFTTVGSFKVAVVAGLSLDIAHGLIPTAVDVRIQSPSISVYDGVEDVIKSMSPSKKPPQDVAVVRNSPDLQTLAQKLERIPTLVELVVEDANGQVALSAGKRLADVELARAVLSFHRTEKANVTLEIGSERQELAVPPAEASVIISGAKLRCGDTPPLVSLSRTRLSARLSSSDVPELSIGFLVESIRLCHWHEEVKRWLPMLPQKSSSPPITSPVTEGEVTSTTSCKQSPLQRLPSNLAVRVSTEVCDCSVGVVGDDSYDLTSYNSPRFRAVLASASSLMELSVAKKDSDGGTTSRSATLSVRVENVYAHVRSVTLPQPDDSSVVRWEAVDDPCVLPTTRKHLLGRPLELASVSVKASSSLSTDAAGDVQPVSVEAEMSSLCVEWSRSLAEAIQGVLIELPLKKKEADSSQTTTKISGRLAVSVELCLKETSVFLVDQQPELAIAVAHISAVNINHQPSRTMSCSVHGVCVGTPTAIPVKVFATSMLSSNVHQLLTVPSVAISKETQAVSVTVAEVNLDWKMSAYKTLTVRAEQFVEELKHLKKCIPLKDNQPPSQSTVTLPSQSSTMSVSVSFQRIHVSAAVGDETKMELEAASLTASVGTPSGVCVSASSVEWGFDSLKIITLEGVSLQPADEDILLKSRQLFSGLDRKNPRSFSVHVQSAAARFAYMYQFGKSLDKLITAVKFLKLLHKKGPKKPDPLPPDLHIVVEDVEVELPDDPFEVKLGDNYELLADEYVECQKRRNIFDKKINELRQAYGELLAAKKADELSETLERKNAQIYYDRSKALYERTPLRTAVLLVRGHQLNILALADPSLDGKENAVAEMRRIDHTSLFPDGGLEFSTLWARKVSGSLGALEVRLRDYPQPLAAIENLTFSGSLAAAEEEPTSDSDAISTSTIALSAPWSDVTVKRSMSVLKFFHNIDVHVEHLEATWGNCWDPAVSQVSVAADILTKESSDPSPPLPFWDKMRLLLHGRLRLQAEQAQLSILATTNPYNDTEKLEVDLKSLDIEHTNARFVVQGGVDVYTRTPSKYDESNIMHLPNICLSLDLTWPCEGDPNDHHSVRPCAPHRAKPGHDSFKLFRSSNLDVQCSLEICADDEGPPESLFYSSTLRFLQQLQAILTLPASPIRRGKLFNNTNPRKISLGRFFRNIHVNAKAPCLNVQYWNSYVYIRGLGAVFGAVTFTQHYLVTLVDNNTGKDKVDGISLRLREDQSATTSEGSSAPTLIRRPIADWKVLSAESEVAGVTMRAFEKSDSMSGGVFSSADGHHLLSVSKLLYFREDTSEEEQLDPGQQPFSHRVVLHDFKGLWTVTNRAVVFGLYNSYSQSQILKMDLSAEALKGLRSPEMMQDEENAVSLSDEPGMETPTKGPPPLNRTLSSGTRAARFSSIPLLEKLLDDMGNKFLAQADEGRGEQGAPELHGHKLCSQVDLLHRTWIVELVNAQVISQATQSDGCVAVFTPTGCVLACVHEPVWLRGELVAKRSWTGIVNDVQYFSSVGEVSSSNIPWLSPSIISQASPKDIGSSFQDHDRPVGRKSHDLDLNELLGGTAGSQVLGGVVDAKVSDNGKEVIQMQRIISPCACQINYVSFGGQPDADALAKTPAPRRGSLSSPAHSLVAKEEEPVDTFTISYPTLDISTNDEQYKLILDVVINLLLHVEPRKKELTERCESMHFKLQLSQVRDQRTPVMELQNAVRDELGTVRQLDRQVYTLMKSLDQADTEENEMRLREMVLQCSNKLAAAKERLASLSSDLRVVISSFRQSQFSQPTDLADDGRDRDRLAMRIEVWFDNAKWRLMQADGQLDLAKVQLSNFSYLKTAKVDGSASHCFELGYFSVQNLLPRLPCKEFKNALGPGEEHFKVDRSLALRVLLVEQASVGGISVKEHFEINVVPLAVRVTSRFYHALHDYFFDKDTPDSSPEDTAGVSVVDVDDTSMASVDGGSHSSRSGVVSSTSATSLRPPSPTSAKERPGSGRRKKEQGKKEQDDVETMKERALQNKTFLYIKIPEVPLVVSYKGDEKWLELNNMRLMLPTLEYHSCTCTYHDLLMQIKKEVQQVILPQAIKQKLRISQGGESSGESNMGDKSSFLGTKSGINPLRASKKLLGKLAHHHPRFGSQHGQSGSPVASATIPEDSSSTSQLQPINLSSMYEELAKLSKEHMSKTDQSGSHT